MAHRFRLDFDGQSVIQDDYNGLAEEASTSEDHVYAELFRLTPGVGSIARGVIPYGTSPMIVANGASGSVLVNPFRVVIGTRTAAASDAVANWQDIRSSLSIADGATALTTLVSLAANASGFTRWDAIYAAVTIDAVSTPTTRKVKNPGTAVVTDESVSVYSHTSVAIGSVAGTPLATPVFPTIPADAGDVYYVLLGYIRVPTGFGASSTVTNRNINESCHIIPLSATTGASTLRPANQSNIDGGTGISGAGTTSNNGDGTGTLKWTGTTTSRPMTYMPASMQGVESLMFVVDVGNASSANWSHQSLAVLDNTRDWRNRICRWAAVVGTDAAASGQTPWGHPANHHLFSTSRNDGSLSSAILSAQINGAGPDLSTSVMGMGSTFLDWQNSEGACFAALLVGGGTGAGGGQYNVPTYSGMVAASYIGVYADPATGNLCLKVSATAPRVVVFFWLDFTAPYPNL